VEGDETYVGGIEEGVRGRKTDTKALVAVACEERGKGIGRIRLRRIDDASGHALETFITEGVEPGSLVHTDGWEGYSGLTGKGYQHRVTVIETSKRSAVEILPRVHLVASLLKRWLLGTHQGAVSFRHLEYYLDEFTFRFNRRTSRSRQALRASAGTGRRRGAGPLQDTDPGGRGLVGPPEQIGQLLESTK
jgi:transposase-like protein